MIALARAACACAGLALVWLACAGQPAPARAADLPENVFAVDPDDAVQHVVFLADERPIFFRFSVSFSGNGFQVAWGNFLIRLHRFLDSNNDGTLTIKEAQRSNWQQLILQFDGRIGGPVEREGMGTSAAKLDADKNGIVTVDELAAFARSGIYAPFGLNAGAGPDPRTLALFGYLDLNHDGRLSTEELAATDQCVQRLDADENELLSIAELKPYENPYANQFRGAPANPGGAATERGSFVVILPGPAAKKLAARLLARYDGMSSGQKDRKLSQAELGIAEKPFRAADADGDGLLTADELERLLAHPPTDVAVLLALARGKPARFELGPAPAGAEPQPTLAGKTQKTRDGSLVIELQSGTLSLSLSDQSRDGLANFYKTQFKNADSDKNGYLDNKEVQQNGIFNQVFSVADRNGDGKLYEPELLAFLEIQSEAFASQATLSISDRGRPLFDIVDANHDNRLSIRELRRTHERLRSADRNGDGLIGANEVPRHYQLAVGRGQGAFQRGFMLESYTGGPNVPGTPGAAGLSWFFRMDRNGDGDLSAREFLGPREEFLRLDADHDGLIDPKEALKGP